MPNFIWDTVEKGHFQSEEVLLILANHYGFDGDYLRTKFGIKKIIVSTNPNSGNADAILISWNGFRHGYYHMSVLQSENCRECSFPEIDTLYGPPLSFDWVNSNSIEHINQIVRNSDFNIEGLMPVTGIIKKIIIIVEPHHLGGKIVEILIISWDKKYNLTTLLKIYKLGVDVQPFISKFTDYNPILIN